MGNLARVGDEDATGGEGGSAEGGYHSLSTPRCTAWLVTSGAKEIEVFRIPDRFAALRRHGIAALWGGFGGGEDGRCQRLARWRMRVVSSLT